MPNMKFLLKSGFLIVSLMLVHSPAIAEATKEDKVKAAIIYKITKFVTWPQKKRALTLCIIGDGSVNSELQKINRKYSMGRRLAVTHKNHTAALDKLCEMVYLHNVDNKTMQKVISKLKGTSILAISDIEQFAKGGGMVELYRSGSRIKFAINRKSVQGANLTISSQLLNLAKTVD